VINHSQKKTKKLKAVVSGHQEFAAKDKRISEELTKNIYLRRELDKLKAERTRETWLLKNDLRNLEKANSELQEQLKEQKKAHQGKPLSSLEYFPLTICLGF
jgi:DNA polymerase III delta prime subunit